MQNTCLVHNSKDYKSNTLSVQAKPFIMQTHFKMSCGSLTRKKGVCEVRSGSATWASNGRINQWLVWKSWEWLQRERWMRGGRSGLALKKPNQSREQMTQCKKSMDAFYKSWIIHSGSDKDGHKERERESGASKYFKKVKCK